MTELVFWLLSGAVLTAAALLLRAALGRRLGAALRYALWLPVLLRLLFPGSLLHASFGVRAWGEELLVREAAAAQGEGAAPAERTADASPGQAPLAGEDRPTPLPPDGKPEAAPPSSPIPWLLRLWGAGAALTALWFAGENLRFWLRLRRGRRLEAGDFPLPVYVVPGLEGSCLFFRRVYLSPAAAEDEDIRAHVLRHELSHCRHGDGLWVALRSAALALHWCDPLVWLAAAASRRDSELAADAGALRGLGPGERQAYGETVIRLSAARSRGGLLTAATGMSGNKRALKERVRRIAREKKTALPVLLAALLLLAVAVGCAFAGGKPQEEGKLCRLTVSSSEGGSLPAGLAETLSGEYPSGTELSLLARPDPGFAFDHWELSGGSSFRLSDPQSADAVLTTGEGDATLTAFFRPSEQVKVSFPSGTQRYEVWHDGAYSSAAGGFSVYASPGEKLTVRVVIPTGEAIMVTWESENGGSFANIHSPETTYTVPEGEDRVSAALEWGEGPAPMPTPEPTPEPTPSPTPAPTPEPTPAPTPTPAPAPEPTPAPAPAPAPTPLPLAEDPDMAVEAAKRATRNWPKGFRVTPEGSPEGTSEVYLQLGYAIDEEATAEMRGREPDGEHRWDLGYAVRCAMDVTLIPDPEGLGRREVKRVLVLPDPEQPGEYTVYEIVDLPPEPLPEEGEP